MAKYKIPKIRIGNNIKVVFACTTDGQPVDLTSAENLTVKVVHEKHKDTNLPTTGLGKSGNQVSFIIKGNVQKQVGEYRVVIEYQQPSGDYHAVDALAFELVARSEEQSVGGENAVVSIDTIYLSGDIITGNGTGDGDMKRSVYDKNGNGTVDNSERFDGKLPNEFAAADHSHSYDALSGKPSLGTASLKNVAASGDAADGQVVLGNDSRLSDSRTPKTHSHDLSDINGTNSLATKQYVDQVVSNVLSDGELTITIPEASETVIGGIKAAPRTAAETEEVKIDPKTSKLYVKPVSGGSGGGGIDMEPVTPGDIFDIYTELILVTGITLSPSDFNLAVGAQCSIVATVLPSTATNRRVSWASSDPEVATVNQSGVVTAMAAGAVTITATALDGSGVSATSSGTIQATEPGAILVTSISLSPPSMDLGPGDEKTVTATVFPTNATNKEVAWSSGNPEVATVDNSGKVKAVAGGSTIVTASAKDGSGVSKSAAVNVDTKLIAYYDFSRYPDGYTGEIEDLSGHGNVPTIAGLESYASGRNGILNGTFMVNNHKTSGSASNIKLTLPNELASPGVLTIVIDAHLRKGYNIYAANGVKNLDTGEISNISSAMIVVVPNNGSRMMMTQDTVAVAGTLSAPYLTAPLDPTIHIDGFASGDNTVTDTRHLLALAVDANTFAAYIDGVKVVETTGKTMNYQGALMTFFGNSLQADIRSIRVFNFKLSESQILSYYNGN